MVEHESNQGGMRLRAEPVIPAAQNDVWDPDASGTKLACAFSVLVHRHVGPDWCLVACGLPCPSRLWSGIRRRLRLGACVVSTPINTGFCSSMPVPCEVRSEKKRIWPAERVPADFLMVCTGSDSEPISQIPSGSVSRFLQFFRVRSIREL